MSRVLSILIFPSTPCLELLQSYRSLKLNKLASYPVWPAVSNHFTHLNALHVIVVTLSCNISCTWNSCGQCYFRKSMWLNGPKRQATAVVINMFAKIPQRLTSPFALLGDEAKLAF